MIFLTDLRCNINIVKACTTFRAAGYDFGRPGAPKRLLYREKGENESVGNQPATGNNNQSAMTKRSIIDHRHGDMATYPIIPPGPMQSYSSTGIICHHGVLLQYMLPVPVPVIIPGKAIAIRYIQDCWIGINWSLHVAWH